MSHPQEEKRCYSIYRAVSRKKNHKKCTAVLSLLGFSQKNHKKCTIIHYLASCFPAVVVAAAAAAAGARAFGDTTDADAPPNDTPPPTSIALASEAEEAANAEAALLELKLRALDSSRRSWTADLYSGI